MEFKPNNVIYNAVQFENANTTPFTDFLTKDNSVNISEQSGALVFITDYTTFIPNNHDWIVRYTHKDSWSYALFTQDQFEELFSQANSLASVSK